MIHDDFPPRYRALRGSTESKELPIRGCGNALPPSFLLNEMLQEIEFLRPIKAFLLERRQLLAAIGSLEPILHILDQTSQSGRTIHMGMGFFQTRSFIQFDEQAL